MNNNLLLKSLIMYKIKTNLSSFLLILSINKGWTIFPLFFFSNKKLENLLFGYVRLYKFSFKVKGFGFKWKFIQTEKIKKTQIIFLKVGFTHKVVLLVKENSRYLLKKRKFILKNRSYNYIRNSLNLLFFLYRLYIYKKKGFYLKGTNFKLKLSKKKTKF